MSTSKRAGFRSGIVTCCLLLALIPACTPLVPGSGKTIRPVGDGGLLSDEPCGPPCFMNIVPGVTKEADAIHILQAEGLCGENRSFDYTGGRGFFCSSNVEISLQQGKDIVDVIFLPSKPVSVGDVIAKYGEPNAVTVGVKSQYPRTWMVLVYADLKINLILPEQEGNTYSIGNYSASRQFFNLPKSYKPATIEI
jgi:hypothetical protein